MEANEALDLVRKSIQKALPDMADAEGKVRTEVFAMPARPVAKMAKVMGQQFTQPKQVHVHAVRLRKIVTAADGTPLLRIVHARVDDQGTILKVTTSR